MQKAVQVVALILLSCVNAGTCTGTPVNASEDEVVFLQVQHKMSRHREDAKDEEAINEEEAEEEEGAASLAAIGSSDFGQSDCACIGIDVPGTAKFWDGTNKKDAVTKPFSYGSTCSPGWCYVDPCKCSLAMTKSTQMMINRKMKVVDAVKFHEIPAYYSYATCGQPGDKNDEASKYCKKNEDNWDAPLLGLKTCKCIGWYLRAGATVEPLFEKSVKSYPGFVGGECMKWDKRRHSDCLVESPPFWCGQKWCWVDPDDCEIPGAPPQLFPGKAPGTYRGKPLYWSYATCGDKDTW